MEQLKELLLDIQPDADYDTCTTLVDEGYLDSFAILSLIGSLEDEFGVTVTPVDLLPENFNSLQAIWNLIQRLQGN